MIYRQRAQPRGITDRRQHQALPWQQPCKGGSWEREESCQEEVVCRLCHLPDLHGGGDPRWVTLTSSPSPVSPTFVPSFHLIFCFSPSLHSSSLLVFDSLLVFFSLFVWLSFCRRLFCRQPRCDDGRCPPTGGLHQLHHQSLLPLAFLQACHTQAQLRLAPRR